LAGTADVGVGMLEMIYGGLPWDRPQVMRDQSPYERVGRVETPTLLLHGIDDNRSPVGQAEMWFSALSSRGVETELVLYPDADHLFLWVGRPSHKIDYSRRLVEWLIRHACARPQLAPRERG
jgi:dipeptidyl aminopeptidase/acylaminoacyl peptidase